MPHDTGRLCLYCQGPMQQDHLDHEEYVYSCPYCHATLHVIVYGSDQGEHYWVPGGDA